MFILVTGGSGSGKSAYAESRITEAGDRFRYYIATMECFDEESRKRVQRHRSMRSGKGFETLEVPYDLAGLALPVSRRSQGGSDNGERSAGEDGISVLLECMSNLTANEMFDPAASGWDSYANITAGIDRLLAGCDTLVVVTNEVFSDGAVSTPEMDDYIKLLGDVNRYMAAKADEVYEVVYGIPVRIKG